jgi:ABC-type sugar transport system ATPase subunit
MDEPLSNLDAKLRAATRLELVDLHRRVETTVVYVTHDQVEAMTMADRIAIMSAGRLQQVGTPQDVYEAPANLFVAQFIGTPPMNTVPGTATTEGGAGVDVGGGRAPLPPGLGTRLEEARPVVVGVRPEHLVVADDGPLELVVRAVEWLGHECLVFGAIGPSPVVVRQAGLSTLVAGSTARLAVQPHDIHLFDPGTTERLA